MSRSTATVFNVLALATIAFLIADNGLPNDDEIGMVLLLMAAPIVSLIALWRPARSRQAEPDPRDILDFDDRLSALEAAERRRSRRTMERS